MYKSCVQVHDPSFSLSPSFGAFNLSMRDELLQPHVVAKHFRTFVIDLIEFDKTDPWFDEARTYFRQLFLNFCCSAFFALS